MSRKPNPTEIGQLTSSQLLDTMAQVVLMERGQVGTWELARSTWDVAPTFPWTLKVEVDLMDAPPMHVDASAALELMAATWAQKVKDLENAGAQVMPMRHKDSSICLNRVHCHRAHVLGTQLAAAMQRGSR